jgi:hypothetical protein
MAVRVPAQQHDVSSSGKLRDDGEDKIAQSAPVGTDHLGFETQFFGSEQQLSIRNRRAAVVTDSECPSQLQRIR